MTSSELRAMSAEELAEKAVEGRQELAKLGMQRYAHRLDRTSDLKAAKRHLARILTVLGEKRRVGAAEGSS